jgi:hypothetical protein
MIADEQGEETYTKILAAAEEIRAMAHHRPSQAAAMFEQAHHLFELARQIRDDWLRRCTPPPIGMTRVTKAVRSADPAADPAEQGWITHSAE